MVGWDSYPYGKPDEPVIEDGVLYRDSYDCEGMRHRRIVITEAEFIKCYKEWIEKKAGEK